MEIPAHVLIVRTGSPSVIEWRRNGRDCRAELPPGSASLLPSELRQATRVFRPLPGKCSVLQIRPGFVDRGIQGIAKGGRMELIRRMDLNEGQISRLMESMRADIAAGSPERSAFGESIALALTAHIAQRYFTLDYKGEQKIAICLPDSRL
jgi:hypothetical protein